MIVAHRGYTYAYNEGDHLLITDHGDNVYLYLSFDKDYIPTEQEVIEVIDEWIKLNT